MTTILDARGNPIKPDKPALSEDIALAHTTSVRNPRPNSVASTITPSVWRACCARWSMATTPRIT